MGFKTFLERGIIPHSIVRAVICMHDLNYFSCLFLPINWFHSACQDPEGTTSPHGPWPASSGVSPGSTPHAQRLGGWWPVVGSPRLACPLAATGPHCAPGTVLVAPLLPQSSSPNRVKLPAGGRACPTSAQAKESGNAAQLSLMKFCHWYPKT